MAATITPPQGYGYVLVLSLGAIPVLAFWHGLVVNQERQKARVPYPNCYATPQEVKTSRPAYTFNCAQRAHAQFLENMTQTMLSMLVAGLVYPRATAVLGAGWLVSRVLYAVGYVYSGQDNGKGRFWGATFWLCQAALWGLCLKMGWDLL